ncbi:MAG TPA: TIGR01440 family protein [Lactobacillus sp.]|nr:TIGR01440 family protein [Lactobacillus sp.]
MDLQLVSQQLQESLTEYFENTELSRGSIFVVGCSTSEIRGEWKGTNSSLEVGRVVIDVLQSYLKPRGIFLAVQGCEHINRALLVERQVAIGYGLETVSVVPAIHAGGGTQVAAFQQMKDPVEVEHIVAQGGIDIGGTDIGMHVKFVQIPIHLTHNEVGGARIVALSSRPKLIGGQRARYTFTDDNLKDIR